MLLTFAAVTFSGRLNEPERFSASVTVIGNDLGPAVVPWATMALNVNVVPLPWNCVTVLPPMAARLPVTARPVLAGFAPGVTVTVSVVVSPGATLDGFALPEMVGLDGDRTVTCVAGAVVALRGGVFASVIVAVTDFAPPDTPFGIVPVNAKTLPPWPVNAGVPRPSGARLPVTVIPVLVGLVPGVTVTVKVIESPMPTDVGEAVIVPDGLVGAGPPRHPGAAFCGVLGVASWKSARLSSVSCPGLRSYPRFRFELPNDASVVPSL